MVTKYLLLCQLITGFPGKKPVLTDVYVPDQQHGQGLLMWTLQPEANPSM